jgi:eukaryotic-like serine/threonine-protein kinase
MPTDPRRVKDLFVAALDQPDDSARQAFLDRECGDDADLRRRLDVLLAAHDRPDAAVDRPLAAPAEDVTVTAAPADVPAGAIVAGRYKLLERIGEGGMGTVWMAEQREPVKRLVAVKLIKAGMDSRAVLARFEAERQALALMDHPNIARVLDGGTTPEGRPYFVMELVKGLPLTDYCDARRLSVRDRLGLFEQVCSAVQHAHQKGVIHRDLKPSNVLVTEHDGKPIPKVIDFGLAKALTGAGVLTDKTLHTAFGAVVGTPLYMAPEQVGINALDVDTRTDVYALGVILYELLTGTTPLEKLRLREAAWDEWRRLIREEEPPRPSVRLSSSDALPNLAANRQAEPKRLTGLVRGELDWIVMKALEKDRNRRYETANGLAMDVHRHLAGEAVQAVPPSAAYRLRKAFRRNRGPVLAAGAVLLALLAGLVTTSYGFYRADIQRQRAEGAERSAVANALAATGAAEAEKAAKHDADEKRRLAEQAAVAERVANEQTQKRLNQIEKGVELLAGMLMGIRPGAEKQGGEPLYEQLRRRAEQAADALDAESVGDPLAVARLQTILGATLRDLGSAAKATLVLEKARGIRERELGAEHLETLVTLDALAGAYRAAGNLPKATALYERVRDAVIKTLGADDPRTLETLNNLALAYREAGRRPEATALLERVRDAKVKRLGADHPDTLATLHNLAGAYRAAGNLPEAIALYEQVRDGRAKRLGADHPRTLDTLHNLALAYRAAGRRPEATALYEQVRDARVKKLGADHPDTLATLNNLGQVYREAGKLPEAIAMFERVRDAKVKRLGADHPSTLITLDNLAGAYRAAGRLTEATALIEQVRDATVKKLGADHPHTLGKLNNLALVYREAGRLPEAIALLEEAATGIAKRQFQDEYACLIIAHTIAGYEQAGQLHKAEGWRRQWLAVVKEKAGADSPAYAGELAALGLNLLQQKESADAEAILREGLAICEKKHPDAWRTFNTQSLLGGSLLGQKKYADAEPLLLKGYEGMKAREKTIPSEDRSRLPEALDRLVEFYTATDNPDEAKKWQAEREKYPTIAPPPRVVKP